MIVFAQNLCAHSFLDVISANCRRKTHNSPVALHLIMANGHASRISYLDTESLKFASIYVQLPVLIEFNRKM